MTASPALLPGLREIADRYDAVLCDVWGVIHNGRKAFGSACEALVKYRELGGRVILLTNAPVPKQQVTRYFEPLGVPDEAFDDVVSSGDATRAVLAANSDKVVWRLGADEGWEHDRHLYEGLELAFADDPAKADLGLIIGLRDQESEHPDDYEAELADIAVTGLPLVCANPDIQVRIGDRLHWCGGALARIYEQLGGRVIYPGKPHAPIYELAEQRLAALGAVPPRARILAIGDGPATDIAGANRQGVDALYVGTGLARHDGRDFETAARALLADAGVRARYVQAELAW